MRPINADRFRADVQSWENCPNGFSDTYDKARIIDAIDEQPTIEAEPVRRGRWVDHQYKEFPVGRYECSVCGARHDMPWDYCPNCGARMEEQE